MTSNGKQTIRAQFAWIRVTGGRLVRLDDWPSPGCLACDDLLEALVVTCMRLHGGSLGREVLSGPTACAEHADGSRNTEDFARDSAGGASLHHVGINQAKGLHR